MTTAQQSQQTQSEKAPSNNQSLVTRETKAFGVESVERSSELAAIAVSSSAKAEVEAAYVMAIKNPRHEDTALTQIKASCRNPRFAASARYRKPVGKKEIAPDRWEQQYVIGPSIRFAEEMIRCWKNVLTQQVSLYDDPIKRIIRITTRDLEANVAYSKEITLDKTVERQNSRDREVLGERMNSYNKKVFIVRTTEDELNIKESALASKVIRTNGLRLIPQHIIDEAMDLVEATIKDKAAKDPAGERRQILDGFAKRGITPIEIERYMSKPSAQFAVDDLVKLREMLTSIEDGHATWQEYLEGTSAQTTDEIAGKSQPDTKGAEVNEKLKSVAQERGVEAKPEPKKAESQTEAKSESKPAPPSQEEASTKKADSSKNPEKAQAAPAETSTPSTQQATQAPPAPSTPEEVEAMKNEIATAEFGLKSTEVGKKKYQAILGVMKLRLAAKQQPLDILTDAQLPPYLAHLRRAQESMKKA